jgi:uncharacterized protein YndB with AHSA1/START domain
MDAPVATAGMLIRRSVDVVREAFVDPAVTTKFWFTHSTERLEPNAAVTWTWAMYGVSTEVRVKAVEPGRLVFDWDNATSPTEVEWTFAPRGEHCFVEIANRGFTADAAGVAMAIDSAGGFSLVLSAAKIWLEHGIDPRFIVDRHPDHHVAGWTKD